KQARGRVNPLSRRGRKIVRRNRWRNGVLPACDNSETGAFRSRLTRVPPGRIKAPLAVREVSQMVRKIAFQGEPGAFSHAAAHALFPADEALPCTTFEDTIAAVQQGRAEYGVVPVENSLYGRITDIYHLLPE